MKKTRKVNFKLYRVTQFANVLKDSDEVFAFEWLALLYIDKVYPTGAYIRQERATKALSWDSVWQMIYLKVRIAVINMRYLWHLYLEHAKAELT